MVRLLLSQTSADLGGKSENVGKNWVATGTREEERTIKKEDRGEAGTAAFCMGNPMSGSEREKKNP